MNIHLHLQRQGTMKGERKSQVLLKCINPTDMKNIEVLRGQTNHNKIPQSEQRVTGNLKEIPQPRT